MSHTDTLVMAYAVLSDLREMVNAWTDAEPEPMICQCVCGECDFIATTEIDGQWL